MMEILIYLLIVYLNVYGITGSNLLATIVATGVVGTAMMIQAYQESKGE